MPRHDTLWSDSAVLKDLQRGFRQLLIYWSERGSAPRRSHTGWVDRGSVGEFKIARICDLFFLQVLYFCSLPVTFYPLRILDYSLWNLLAGNAKLITTEGGLAGPFRVRGLTRPAWTCEPDLRKVFSCLYFPFLYG